MDLFNSLIIPPGNYPPFAQLMYRIISKIIPAFPSIPPVFREQAFQLRASVPGAFILMCHIMLFILPLFILIYLITDGNTVKKILYSSIISLSGIVIWSLERGNIIIYAFIFTFLFIVFYKSEKKWQRYLAYIFLAIAANIKLYPAIFGLFILLNKDWKGSIICFVDFLLIYILSFFLLQLFTSVTNSGSPTISMIEITASLDNLKAWSANVSSRPSGLNCSIKNFFLCINGVFLLLCGKRTGFINSELIFHLLQLFILVICLFIFIKSTKKWQKIFSLVMCCIYIPSVSYQYSMIFLLIPLSFFINDDNLDSKLSNFYAFAFAVCISMLIIPIKIDADRYFLSGGFIIQQCIMALMLLSVFIETIINCKKRTMETK